MVIKLTILKVLEPFLSKPLEKLHLAEISREIKEPHPTVRMWLNFLEEKGVLKKEYKGRLTLYSLNSENANLMDYLTITEKNRIIEKCEKEIILKELVSLLNSELKDNSKALIFGSATDSIKKASDIDLLIIGRINEKTIKNFAGRINKEIHLININRLDKVSESLKKEIIKKHLIIKGSEDLIRWMLW